MSAYDADANLVRQVSRAYGPECELLSVWGSVQPVWYTYNALYRTKTLTDGNGHVTNYYYDDEDSAGASAPKMTYLTKIVYPAGDSISFPQYDPLGRISQQIANSITTNYHYDGLAGALSHIEYAGSPNQDVYYDYDSYGRPSAVWDGNANSSSFHSYKISCAGYDDLDLPGSMTTTYAACRALA